MIKCYENHWIPAGQSARMARWWGRGVRKGELTKKDREREADSEEWRWGVSVSAHLKGISLKIPKGFGIAPGSAQQPRKRSEHSWQVETGKGACRSNQAFYLHFVYLVGDRHVANNHLCWHKSIFMWHLTIIVKNNVIFLTTLEAHYRK